MVAPHCVAESFICHNLRFPVQEGHETLLHCLQLLLVHLRKKNKNKRVDDGGQREETNGDRSDGKQD